MKFRRFRYTGFGVISELAISEDLRITMARRLYYNQIRFAAKMVQESSLERFHERLSPEAAAPGYAYL
jgi:hypothetical protein